MAVGTELLLGQVVDTNAAHIADRLALAGIDSLYQTKVGDNEERIAEVVRIALGRSDAVIVCGGLGPTQDDVTREGIARALEVPLVSDPAMVANIKAIFAARRRAMPESNLRQADRPEGAVFVPQERGTAPGLIVEAGDRVVYAVPGVPHEMEEMLDRAVIPDLERRAGVPAVILSRVLRTWGVSEAGLGEAISDRVKAQTNPTIAFLAKGIEGLCIRITAKAPDVAAAKELLAAEETELRAILGDLVFGVDDQTMERVVADLLLERGLTVGVAESLTGGLVGARLAEAEGASAWLEGSIVAYDTKVKHELLGVPEGPVVSRDAAQAMAEGACAVLRADVGMGITGVAGPTTQDDQPVGTVFMAVSMNGDTEVTEHHFPGDRQHIRQFSAITLLDMLRRRLLAGR
ncbi:MAG: competence/damage-inducible protein A [Actinomycetota bacterium]|nr:competence/damage-inducible protein A [Actinomycetota bacterium]